eukprot:scaffold1564_cov389-Prasinococcus_capsulatus_cf.AAC.5
MTALYKGGLLSSRELAALGSAEELQTIVKGLWDEATCERALLLARGKLSPAKAKLGAARSSRPSEGGSRKQSAAPAASRRVGCCACCAV